MPFKEVFKNPTVKQVIFQIVFPRFFAMESKIGEYQLKIMDNFPQSQLLIQNQFFITQAVNIGDANRPVESNKIWQFKNKDGDITIEILSDTLNIVSTKHKTYNNEYSKDRFRDIITDVVQKFLSIIPLIKITRIGLRYVNECPLPQDLTNESFLDYYKSYINLDKIDNILDCDLLSFNSVTNYNNLIVRYSETFKKVADKYSYDLDFDGQMNDIPAGQYITAADQIHEKIGNCYQEIINEPVIKIMRNEQ